MNVFKELRRSDKWYLGGGKKTLWAPEFPLWLEQLGFWDHACYLDWRVEPLFTITILDEKHREITPVFQRREWVPSHLTQWYRTDAKISLVERRCLLPLDALTSVVTLKNNGKQPRQLKLVVWTCQNTSGRDEGIRIDEPQIAASSALSFRRRYFTRDKALNIEIYHAFGAAAKGRDVTFSVNLSEASANHPRWRLTPFYETFNGKLPNEMKANVGVHPAGYLYLGLCYPLTLPAGGTVTFVAACALDSSREKSLQHLHDALNTDDPIAASQQEWQSFFDNVPTFTCSDEYIQRYYWYRWFGLKLNMVDTQGEHRLPHPCVFEGTNAGWFRHHISYSAQCHMLECRWMRDPSVAQGSVRNFCENQMANGSFPGGILTGWAERGRGFYHANWGAGVKAVYALHPDDEFLKAVYAPLCRYAEHFQRDRDKENWHLYDIINQGETGQEYMSRYLFARPDADDWGAIQLKGVDATVYIYELQKTLAWMAEKLGKTDEALHWAGEAQQTKVAVLTRMWDDRRHLFFDVHPKTGQRSFAKAAVGFYPFMTDLAGHDHLTAFSEHLFNPKEFATPFPVPSTSLDDDYSSPRGEWKGKRHACPWNGRAWLMTNSHVADALARAAQTLDASLKKKAVDFIHRFIRLMFIDRDPQRPTSCEYYNPLTGQAPFFRGVDDYMHSWVVDLIIKYVAGVQPDEDKIVIDPLPFGLQHFTLDNVFVRGHILKVAWKRGVGLKVWLDGQLVVERKRLERVEIEA